MQSGIYAIANMTSGKVYIGSTIGFRKRWRIHRSRLRHGVHDNPHLQYAWDKYGGHAFEFLVCEHVEDTEQLHLREQYWLDYHRMITEVYNYGLIARHPRLGRCGDSHHTEKTRRKLSEASTRSYPAFIHQITGEIIPAGVNLKALCQKRGLHHGSMSSVKNGRRSSHKHWVLLSEHFQRWLL